MYRKWTVEKCNSMTMNEADSNSIDDPRTGDAFAIASILVNLCFSLANHCSQSVQLCYLPTFYPHRVIWIIYKKAVLSQGNRAMQRVFPTPNDSLLFASAYERSL